MNHPYKALLAVVTGIGITAAVSMAAADFGIGLAIGAATAIILFGTIKSRIFR